MNLLLIAVSFSALLFIAYRAYGGFLSKQLDLNDARITPAHQKNDGIDFIPTRPFWLFAQHFSAISAAGPIAGPIIACMMWGWLPCLVWIALGVVLIGAMHDFLSLTISVRHGATSIATVAKDNLGERAGFLMMVFIWLALIYVIVSFTDITSGSFVGVTEELSGTLVNFNPGGAVALAAVIYLGISLLLGLTERFLKPKAWFTTIIFVPLTFASIWFATKFSTLLIFDAKTWCLLILGYCCIGSLMPVWLLLQPRGYLGGFILYSALFVGVVGLLFGNYEIKQQAFKSIDPTLTTSLFPFLFVTIACGACSGFHGLVCSGTTAKQIDKESHMKSVGYGAMLCEAMVALIALATVMIWAPSEIAGLKPGAIYGKGIGEFLTLIIGKEHLMVATTFGAMAFSTFVFDTLDVATRLGRYLVQELLNLKGNIGAVLATLITMALPVFFVINAQSGSYLQFWTLFGASNQLLAALTLLSITVWLYQARKRIAFTLIPMLFVLVVTAWALLSIAWDNLINKDTSVINTINGLISLSLIGLAIFLIKSAIVKVHSLRPITLPFRSWLSRGDN
jgi:carbon starvation protein